MLDILITKDVDIAIGKESASPMNTVISAAPITMILIKTTNVEDKNLNLKR
jgi:hypothetical protein